MTSDEMGLSVGDGRAADNDPQLGVHELSECAFCRRAFLLLHENKEPDSGKDREINLDYEPAYFPAMLEWEMRFLRRLQRIVAVLGVAVLVVSVIFALWGHSLVLWTALISTVLCFGFVGLIESRVSGLQKILEGYHVEEPVIPPETSREVQDVDWRGLLAAEFEPFRYENALIDADLKLGGKPWCYLVKGDLHIPVFHYRMQDAHGRKQIHRQHYARIGAYCHLIASQTGHTSPYGIVLFADSFEAKVIPNHEMTRRLFLHTLLEARETVRSSVEGASPPMPGHRFCSGCHWGFPIPVTKKETPFHANGKPLPVARKVNLERTEVYHSWCGDRFLETPPHAKAVELGLYEP